MIQGKKILVIGGTGSLGKKICDLMARQNNIAVYSRDEQKHWGFKTRYTGRIKSYVGDIRDFDTLRFALLDFKPNIVINAAAMKHVDYCESFPEQSILTNVNGVNNLVRICGEIARSDSWLETVLQVSTDKATMPLNVYGMCKAIAERIVTSKIKIRNTKFIGVRYGNVLESNGSVIPLFKKQSEEKDCITLTDENMTRYIMTLKESVDLICNAIENASPGEIFIPKLKAMRISDLAEIFSVKSGKPIKVIGIRPGEKIHESLLSLEESIRAYEKNGVIALRNSLSKQLNSNVFQMSSNQNILDIEDLQELLISYGIL